MHKGSVGSGSYFEGRSTKSIYFFFCVWTSSLTCSPNIDSSASPNSLVCYVVYLNGFCDTINGVSPCLKYWLNTRYWWFSRQLTEKELFICAFWHLNAFHCPIVQNHSSNDGRRLKVIISQATSCPWPLISYFSLEFFLGPQSRHVVRFSLKLLSRSKPLPSPWVDQWSRSQCCLDVFFAPSL